MKSSNRLPLVLSFSMLLTFGFGPALQACEETAESFWGYRARQLVGGGWGCDLPYVSECQKACICDENGVRTCCTTDGSGGGDC